MTHQVAIGQATKYAQYSLHIIFGSGMKTRVTRCGGLSCAKRYKKNVSRAGRLSHNNNNKKLTLYQYKPKSNTNANRSH